MRARAACPRRPATAGIARARARTAPSNPGFRIPAKGFTLLEVLVALLLLALALVAMVRLAGMDARAQAQLRDGTLAQWVAANAVAEARLRMTFPAVGRSSGEARMGGQRWRWTLDVEPTQEIRVRRLDVTVVAVDARSEAGVAARLTAFASQP